MSDYSTPTQILVFDGGIEIRAQFNEEGTEIGILVMRPGKNHSTEAWVGNSWLVFEEGVRCIPTLLVDVS